MCINKLILGDNLDILKEMESETVDLIYLDPPFFSNRDYEVIWGDEGEVRSFQDRWAGGIDHYIAWLKERVEQMYRVLKPTGSIFLHCDWHADAYIRVEILDRIFGRNNFRNEIIWCYKKWATGNKIFCRNHDNIFFYSKTDNYTYNQLLQERADSTQKRFGNQVIVSGFDDSGKRIPSQTADEDSKGVKMYDWWDVPIIPPSGHERIGYPTQKPMALLERIIKCASNEGDVVLDPFVGGGTTVAVADKLHRKWIGIDQSVQAVKVTELRLNVQTDLFTRLYANSYTLQLHKYDYDTLRYKDAFEFEAWIIGQFGGSSNAKQRNDYGLDGKMSNNTPIQVKRSDNIGRNVIDNFIAAAMRADKKLFDKNIEDKKPV
ncbi:MAG: site-specific DNA-methyltransferase, partial [Prevotellaceae bacterium]|nr:site-specific DNA-methyltransferase [Prevotellaceae bacterium]